LTDGHTYGDADACLSLAEKAYQEGIGISAFGIGAEWNDQFLDKLVAPSGGQSGYIEAPAQIIEFLQQCIHGLGHSYAQNLRLVTDFPVGMRLSYGFKVAPFAQPLACDTAEIKLGVLETHAPLTVLLELTVEPQLPGKGLVLPLTFWGDIPTQPVNSHIAQHNVVVRVSDDSPVEDVPEELIAAVRALNFYRMNEHVWQEVEAGDVDLATMRLRRLTNRLLEAGHTKLAEQAYAETEQLRHMGTLSLEGRKRLKYGTRSLMTQAFHLDES
jgi:Ca-activated chloride channel homolog